MADERISHHDSAYARSRTTTKNLPCDALSAPGKSVIPPRIRGDALCMVRIPIHLHDAMTRRGFLESLSDAMNSASKISFPEAAVLLLNVLVDAYLVDLDASDLIGRLEALHSEATGKDAAIMTIDWLKTAGHT